MTRAEFLAHIRFAINRNSSALADSYILTSINWALRDLADAHTFEEMRKTYEGTLTADESLYSFPANMKDLYTFVLRDDSNSRKLVYVRARTFDEMYPDPSNNSTGRPERYVDHGTYLQLDPITDSAYTVRCRCSVYNGDLEGSTSEPLFDGKDPIIIARAMAHTNWLIKEPEMAEYWNRLAQERLQIAIMGDHSAEDWTPVARPFTSSPSIPYDHTNPWTGR